MELKIILKHALLIVVVTVSTLLAVFLAIFPSVFTGANDFIYTRTPSGVLITSPVSLRLQGVFGTDFCIDPTIISYSLQISGYTAGNIPTERRLHEQGEVVDDTWVLDLPVGRYQTISMRCYATSTGNQLIDQTLEFNGAGGTIFEITGEPTINVVKVVVNDNGGTKVISDFPLFVGGTPVVSGVTNIFPVPASYIVTETGDPNYTQSFSGDCDINGNINLVQGDSKFCIITNDDIAPSTVTTTSSGGGGGAVDFFPPPIPPLIDVVKVPNPLALPGGPGPVTYTYTLSNIGTVTANNITMAGDTCSPIVLVSGDTNSDSKLDVNETWTYTCTTILTETHTNNIVATGWANGISAVDIASSTVVVGVPGLPDTGVDETLIVPPLINITKVPSPLTLLYGGGTVTYKYKITNPGTSPLDYVYPTDDRCAPIIYISGDVNGDLKLNTTETWTYSCQTNLTQTTTNTVTARGEANNLVARDFAVATVVVSSAIPSATVPTTGMATPTPSITVVATPEAPTLPNAGAAFYIQRILLNLAILIVVIVILVLLYEERRKRANLRVSK